MTRIGGLLLAAGRSIRTAGPKLLQRINGRTILGMSVANHLASRLACVVVTIPGWAEEGFAAELETFQSDRLHILKIEQPCPMSESLKQGWRWLKESIEVDAVSISLADKPLIKPEIINQVIDAYLSKGLGICVPVYNGSRGHPVIISLEFTPEIMELEGDCGARKIIEKHQSSVGQISMDDDAIVFDVDNDRDFEILEGRLGHGRS